MKKTKRKKSTKNPFWYQNQTPVWTFTDWQNFHYHGYFCYSHVFKFISSKEQKQAVQKETPGHGNQRPFLCIIFPANYIWFTFNQNRCDAHFICSDQIYAAKTTSWRTWTLSNNMFFSDTFHPNKSSMTSNSLTSNNHDSGVTFTAVDLWLFPGYCHKWGRRLSLIL